MKIPPTQKLNQGAPSHVSVSEKSEGEKMWNLTKEIKLNGLAALGTEIDFTQEVELKSNNSEIAVHSTIYHFGKKDTKVPCFIQGFQGFTKRNKKLKSNSVTFAVEGKVY